MKKYFVLLLLLPILALIYYYSVIYPDKKLSKTLTIKPSEYTMSLLFIGDIMGHKGQIVAAYDKKNKSYNYDTTFNKVAPIIKDYDFALANLEVTLAGPPYSGYPSFSSPVSLAEAAKKAGIDICFTANNHACDKGSKGIKKTIKALDDLNITHTGTFSKVTDRNASNLIVLEKDTIRVGLLNYTEHTNWVPTPKGMFVNRLDMKKVIDDINKTSSKKLDKLILMVHWGAEYKHLPQKRHKALAEKLFKAGADIIIGSHPHVLQPMYYSKESNTTKEKLIYYSLGNFVSDQRRRYTNGGGLAGLVLSKKEGKTVIKKQGYHLIWVNKHKNKGRNIYEVLPVKSYEHNKSYLKGYAKKKIEEFITDSRKLLKKHNKNVTEW